MFKEGSSCLLTRDNRGIGWDMSSMSVNKGCPPPNLSMFRAVGFDLLVMMFS